MRHGVRLFARTQVTQIEEQGERSCCAPPAGHTVTASHVAVCAGYESLEFPAARIRRRAQHFRAGHRAAARASELATLPLIWESARPYLYIRGTPDGRLMVGGADVPFKNAAARDLLLPRQVRRLAEQYRDLFGEELPPMAYAWAGSFAETRDGLPFIGRVPGMDPRLQFALCYGGNGITYSVHAGDMIRAGIEGRPHALDDVFGFGRLAADGSADRLTG